MQFAHEARQGIGSWEPSERAGLTVDGALVWFSDRGSACTGVAEGTAGQWENYAGAFPNPFGITPAPAVCQMRVDIVVPHTASTLALAVTSNIDSTSLNDEAWGFTDPVVTLNA